MSSDTLFVGSFGDRKLKRKIDESSTIDGDSDLSLSMSLGGNYVVHESSSKSALKSLKANEDIGFDPKLFEKSNDNELIKFKDKQFSCKFCDKKFPNPQALGGHQNSHRRERILSRVDKEFAKSTYGLGSHSCPYSSLTNHHLFGGSPFCHRAHMQPMAHMSPMAWNSFDIGNDNRGLYNTSFLAHQYEMTSNLWDTSAEIRQRLNHGDMDFAYELDQVPSLERNVVNRSATTHHDLEGLLGNYYTRNR